MQRLHCTYLYPGFLFVGIPVSLLKAPALSNKKHNNTDNCKSLSTSWD